ncbi:hypothetical protein T11_8383 [Trichinella zimbabwensis]|uniref:Uncharacterized protein n=1 Tax=Trichinella zimbabwensis TaxID=268475 RepID=A0A0V1GJ75_9BILA|nr:hypothetical protein T11_8383 [Trichinella zimbabwensis]
MVPRKSLKLTLSLEFKLEKLRASLHSNYLGQ